MASSTAGSRRSTPAKLSPYSSISTSRSRRLVEEYKHNRRLVERRTPDDYVTLGQAYLSSGYAEPAIRCFSVALMEGPPRVDAIFGRANAYELMGRHETAIVDYTACIQLDPLTPQLFKSRASALLSLERYDEALREWHAAMAISSFDEDPDAKEAYGRTLFELGRHEQAEAELTALINADGTRAFSHYFRACARLELYGEGDQGAASDFAKAHSLDPSLPTVLRERAAEDLAAGRVLAAASTLGRCIRLDPYDATLLLERARCWLRLDEPQEESALADLEECTARLEEVSGLSFGGTSDGHEQTLIDCLTQHTELLLRRGEAHRAGPLYDKLLRARPPPDAPVSAVMGRLRATLGARARALALGAASSFRSVRGAAATTGPWPADVVRAVALDSDTLCDLYAADGVGLDRLVEAVLELPDAHYCAAQLGARRARELLAPGELRAETLARALADFGAAHRAGFDVRSRGRGRPGVLVTTAWAEGCLEPAPDPAAEHGVPSLRALAVTALALAECAADDEFPPPPPDGASASGAMEDAADDGDGVGSVRPSSQGSARDGAHGVPEAPFVHEALAAHVARSCLPLAPVAAARLPPLEVGRTLLHHVGCLWRAARPTQVPFEPARWVAVAACGGLLCASHAYGGAMPEPAPNKQAKGTPRAEPRSLLALAVTALGRAMPRDPAVPPELPAAVRAARRARATAPARPYTQRTSRL